MLPLYYYYHSSYRAEPLPARGGGGGGREEDVVSVHSVLVIGGYIGCGVSMVFCVLLVFLGPGPVGEQGALRYISDGMEVHCGYTTVVMGTCTLLVLACQLVAAVHMASGGALWCALAEAVSWNVVLGVSDTGWKVHYAGLVVFLFSGLCYHRLASCDPGYGGGGYYARLNTLAWLFTGVFAVVAGTSIGLGDAGGPVLHSFAVAFEFVLLAFMAAQNGLLIRALDQFRDIRLRFERYPPSGDDPLPPPPLPPPYRR
jgi:hypothetical protein